MPQIHLLCWDEENKPPSRSCLIQAGQRQVNQRSWTRIEIKPPAFGINVVSWDQMATLGVFSGSVSA